MTYAEDDIKFPILKPTAYGPVTKLKNLSDVYSILLGGVENDFQLVIQKENYEITSALRGKNF